MGRVAVSVHQPNLVPHERLLDKIRQSDVFVVLAHAQFEKGGYVNRFRHQDRWYTLAVNRGLQPIIEKQYVNPLQDWTAIMRRLPEHGRFFAECLPFLKASLLETNLCILNHMLTRWLNVTVPIFSDYPTELRGTARLVDLCRHHGATTYLSGPSGAHYLDRQSFADAGIELVIQEPGPTRSGLEVLRDAAL